MRLDSGRFNVWYHLYDFHLAYIPKFLHLLAFLGLRRLWGQVGDEGMRRLYIPTFN
jgi:hypothetical protein